MMIIITHSVTATVSRHNDSTLIHSNDKCYDSSYRELTGLALAIANAMVIVLLIMMISNNH